MDPNQGNTAHDEGDRDRGQSPAYSDSFTGSSVSIHSDDQQVEPTNEGEQNAEEDIDEEIDSGRVSRLADYNDPAEEDDTDASSMQATADDINESVTSGTVEDNGMPDGSQDDYFDRRSMAETDDTFSVGSSRQEVILRMELASTSDINDAIEEEFTERSGDTKVSCESREQEAPQETSSNEPSQRRQSNEPSQRRQSAKRVSFSTPKRKNSTKESGGGVRRASTPESRRRSSTSNYRRSSTSGGRRPSTSPGRVKKADATRRTSAGEGRIEGGNDGEDPGAMSDLNIPSAQRPEWFEDLGSGELQMFRQVFDMLDKDGGGSLDASELYSVLKELDINVELEEIQAVLGELDKDGNGEIDFDEFLYAMAETDNYLSLLSKDPEKAKTQHADEAYTKRQTLFFTAITRFAIKHSTGEIERYYTQKMRQAPHVISYYTAGARLIGLNDKQLEKQMLKMQKAARGNDSPYAKPLPFIIASAKKKRPMKKRPCTAGAKATSTPTHLANKPKSAPLRRRTRKQRKAINADGTENVKPDINKFMGQISNEADLDTHDLEPSALQKSIEPDLNKGMDSEECSEEMDTVHDMPDLGDTSVQVRRRTAVMKDEIDHELLGRLRDLASRGSIVARIPDIQLIPQIRNKIESGDDQLCSSIRKRRRTVSGNHHRKSSAAEHSPIPDKKEEHHGSTFTKPHGWREPEIKRGNIPLPVIKVTKSKVHTIEDVPKIRKQVSKALDKYYTELRQAHIKVAYEHWDKLHTNEIRSDELRENFRQVYKAYSPHSEGDVMCVSPWVPHLRYSSSYIPRLTPMTPTYLRGPPIYIPRSQPPAAPRACCGSAGASRPMTARVASSYSSSPRCRPRSGPC